MKISRCSLFLIVTWWWLRTPAEISYFWNKLKTKHYSRPVREGSGFNPPILIRQSAKSATTPQPPWLAVVFSILFDIYKELILLFTTFTPVSWRQCPHCPHDILSKFAAPWVLIRLLANEINWKLNITAVLSERVRGSIHQSEFGRMRNLAITPRPP